MISFRTFVKEAMDLQTEDAETPSGYLATRVAVMKKLAMGPLPDRVVKELGPGDGASDDFRHYEGKVLGPDIGENRKIPSPPRSASAPRSSRISRRGLALGATALTAGYLLHKSRERAQPKKQKTAMAAPAPKMPSIGGGASSIGGGIKPPPPIKPITPPGSMLKMGSVGRHALELAGLATLGAPAFQELRGKHVEDKTKQKSEVVGLSMLAGPYAHDLAMKSKHYAKGVDRIAKSGIGQKLKFLGKSVGH